MEQIKELFDKKLGFGCMRLPVIDQAYDKIDEESFCKMIDTFMEQGFKYFDTAYPYHMEKSEEAVGRCLVDRYERESFYLADKMPVWLVKSEEDYAPIFQTQLERCHVEYFDFYLLHAMEKERIKDTEETGGFKFVQRMKEEGKIRHIGFSFHDTADVLEETLKNHPEVEFVQLQLNYYDWESEKVQSRKCYEVAVKYGVAVIVMEPVKGGMLAKLTGEPADVITALGTDASFASYAIRYVASLDQVVMVLSGMSDQQQLEDNISYMKEFVPLSQEEKTAIEKACEIMNQMPTIGCTGCRYCVDGCPQKILIPKLFDVYNLSLHFGMTDAVKKEYARAISENGKATECIKCGKCETHCPQHLEIRQLLEMIGEKFE